MVRGNTLFSNKGAPADESSFRETEDTLNYPRGYHDALENTKMVDKGEMKGDTIETVDWTGPVAFQDSYQEITHSTQTAVPTELKLN